LYAENIRGCAHAFSADILMPDLAKQNMVPPVVFAAIPAVITVGKWVYEHGFKARVEGPPSKSLADSK
jgi:hypothetical protein